MVMRRVDKLGRIVIPSELRRKYGITPGIKMEFFDVGDGITVKPTEAFCAVCRGRISDHTTFPLCEACIAEAVKVYHGTK